jgi:hypothetical protein
LEGDSLGRDIGLQSFAIYCNYSFSKEEVSVIATDIQNVIEVVNE